MSLLYRLTGKFPSVIIAKRNISRAKTRSALAALAIVIGVVAIGAVGGASVAFKESQFALFEEQGANNVFVSPGFDADERFLDREDVLQIQEAVGSRAVVGTAGSSGEYVKRADRREDVGITYMEDPRVIHDIGRGELPTNWRDSAVVSDEFAREYGLGVGDRITLVTTRETPAGEIESRDTYRVAAVLTPTSQFGVDEVFLPLSKLEAQRYDQVQVITESADRAEAVADDLDERFNGRKDELFILELSSIVRFIENLANSINLFLIALASISLVVAAVAIANTMLMAVIKRREEIGVLRAVGYQRGDVLRILLVESTMLGALGTAVGMAIALAVSVAANAIFLGDPLAFTGEALTYLGGAAVFGILVSLIAGVYPAWRAANDRPVDALRG
ncbi:ABC transporter permease [Halobaculum sp. MBLA0147]|uniref:ABC transporter permease n=1 Tax=Halobaculum sp. MBLA0147 TaxID=3079934 RepID=UPI0035232EC1